MLALLLILPAAFMAGAWVGPGSGARPPSWLWPKPEKELLIILDVMTTLGR